MDSLKNATGQGKAQASEHTEEQKKQLYDNLPQEQKEKQTYTEWATEAYHDQYEKWMPWIEDQYLKWFGKDNKASYAAKENLDKTKVTGISQVDKLQDDVNNLASNQLGKDGLLRPVGDMASKEGINRAERGGKDDSGSYGGPASSVTDPAIQNAQSAGQGIAGGAKSAGNTLMGGAQSAGNTVGGMFGGGGEKKQ